MVKSLKMYRSYGVDALVDSETEQDPPLCEHGKLVVMSGSKTVRELFEMIYLRHFFKIANQ